MAVGGGVYPSGSGPILASGVRCIGDESILYLCGNDTVLDSNCTRQRDAGVMCNPGSGMYAMSKSSNMNMFYLISPMQLIL